MTKLEGDVWLSWRERVAKLEGDVWLNWRERGAKLEGDGWLSWREISGLVGSACLLRQLSGVLIQT